MHYKIFNVQMVIKLKCFKAKCILKLKAYFNFCELGYTFICLKYVF